MQKSEILLNIPSNTIDTSSNTYIENPYPFYKHMREHSPICLLYPVNYWGVTRYHDVLEALQRPQIFSSKAMNDSRDLHPRFSKFIRNDNIIGLDPPAHGKMRRVIAKAFTPQRIDFMAPRLKAICQRYLNLVPMNETFDYITEFATPFPVHVISEILGVDPGMHSKFKIWSNELLNMRVVTEMKEGDEKESRINEVVNRMEEFEEYINQIIEKRKHSRGEDLISAMWKGAEEGDAITPCDLMTMVRLLITAGNETTTNLIAHGMIHLLKNPILFQQLKSSPQLIPSFVEELARFDTPAIGPFRELTQDYELAGHLLKKGERVLLFMASANHDETVFSSSDKFILDRPNIKSHIGFGHGPHFCIGAYLARLEALLAFKELVKKARKIELVGKICRTHSYIIRGVSSLPVKLVS